MIISGLGTVLISESLLFASSFLEDENLRPGAEIACFNIIERVMWTGWRDKSIEKNAGKSY